MELNHKVKELEDELKVLKAEIRNVLLDIREVVLDKANPLTEEQGSAFLRMDLNTTARTVAAEAAGREAGKAVDQAEADAPRHADSTEGSTTEADGKQAAAEPQVEDTEGEETSDEEPGDEQPKAERTKAEQKTEKKETDTAQDKGEDTGSAPRMAKGKASRKGKGSKQPVKPELPEDAPLEVPDIPSMYRASAQLSASAVGLAEWVSDAVREVGAPQLDRVITIHRLCGTLPPNISEALAHIQELIRSSDGEMSWLNALRDLGELASA